MAKAPGTPKPKTEAPAQFDMNSRERKGGKGGFGGQGRGKTDKRPPAQIVTLPPTTVDRGEGWIIQKIGKIDQASHTAMGAEYRLVFDGHDALVFDYLSAARDRSKEAPPERPEPPPSVQASAVEDEAVTEPGDETPPDHTSSEHEAPEHPPTEAVSAEHP